MAYQQQPQQYGGQPPLQQAPHGQPPPYASHATSAPAVAAPPPPQPPLEFHVFVDGTLRRKALRILHADKITPAYFVELSRKQLVVHRGNESGPVIGRVGYHTFSPGKMDLVFGSQPEVEMKRVGLFSKNYSVALPAAGSPAPFAWHVSLGGHISLMDGAGATLADFSRSMKPSKDGVLTMGVFGVQQEFMDQIIISFVAVEEMVIRTAAAAGAAAA
ncbi:hypothetical protein BDV95DRAFT_594968 [Massariosphaeria phaeospora]|uniref:Tubby C-terminal-like domain-containing protein n=1 Tax=Massariosphaeria phaeospora TaxID=100035 RepID=A0A7C8M940_9PLEO|nr:hypothetical protein BDV95DRAFT_594968 [Massariosphaeria phaeospora]